MAMVRLQNCWIFSPQPNASGSYGWLPDVFIGCFSINVSWRLCLFGGYAVCLLAASLFIYYVCGWSLALFTNVCTGFLTEGEGSIRLTSLYLVQISCFLYWRYIFSVLQNNLSSWGGREYWAFFPFSKSSLICPSRFYNKSPIEP